MHCENCKALHRRAQKAEAEVERLKKQMSTMRVNPWASESRQAEAEERDRVANLIQRAKENYNRWNKKRS